MIWILNLCNWMADQILNVSKQFIFDKLFSHLHWLQFIYLFFHFPLKLLHLILWVCFELLILLHLTYFYLKFQRLLKLTYIIVFLFDLCCESVVKISKHLGNNIFLVILLLLRYQFELHLRPKTLYNQLHELHWESLKLFNWPSQTNN